MHSSLILLTIVGALVWRWRWSPMAPTRIPWQTRWVFALSAFCLPPLMVVLAAAAVLAMGHHGTMMGRSVSPVGCWVSLGVLALSTGSVAFALGRAAQNQWHLRQYPIIALPTGGQARCLPIPLPLAAQVGLGRSSLLVSQGWLEQLTAAEQQATISHEQAHAHYHDPLCFLGLGVIRRFGSWLPNTEALWAELLLLRELRADQRAATTSDPLLLAELLVKLSRQITLAFQPHTLDADLEPWVGFNDTLSLSRLEQRVNALLEPSPQEESTALGLGHLVWLLVTALPLATTWLHT